MKVYSQAVARLSTVVLGIPGPAAAALGAHNHPSGSSWCTSPKHPAPCIQSGCTILHSHQQ